MGVIEEFFRDIDRRWSWPADHAADQKVHLLIIGSSALMLQTSYQRGTKDSDVLETADLTEETKIRLLSLAGKNAPLFHRHRIYLELVPSALPFLPQVPSWHPIRALNADLAHVEIEALDVVDVVVSKFKRANASDMSDIAAMIDAGHVPHTHLIDRFRAAVDTYSCDARAEDLPKYVAALHRAERDFFGVPETEIELPDWI